MDALFDKYGVIVTKPAPVNRFASPKREEDEDIPFVKSGKKRTLMSKTLELGVRRLIDEKAKFI